MALGVGPSTAGRLAGQGGKFYERLCAGKRVWPETADAVRKRLDELQAQKSLQGNDVALPDVLPPVADNHGDQAGIVASKVSNTQGGTP